MTAADQADESPWPELQRASRTVVVIDVVESVRLMRQDEEGFIRRWRRIVEVTRDDSLPRFDGQMVKHLGDGMLLAFDDSPRALSAVIALKSLVEQVNTTLDDDHRILLRVGIHACDVVIEDWDILGTGVNVAARLAAQAAPDQILLSAQANEGLHPSLDQATEDLGDLWLKHLDEPVRTYAVCEPGGSEAPRPAESAADALKPVVAVMPFATEGASASGVTIGELVADDLIHSLSAWPELRVVSRLSTRVLALRGVDADESGATLRADYVVTGICRAMNDQVLVHAQVFDVRRAEVLDAFRAAGSASSLFTDESPLIRQLLSQIGARLLERQVELAHKSALPNQSGHTLLLGGIALMHRLSQRDVRRSFEMLDHLCNRWPRLAAPHAWKARWHLFSVLQGWSPDVQASRRSALEDSDRALQIDEGSSTALAVAGSVTIGLSRDVDQGVRLYQRALAANPSDSFAWMLLGTAHAFKGEGGHAMQASVASIQLSPLDPMHFLYDCHAAGAALAADDPALALSLARRSLRANAQHLSTLRVLAIAQLLSGQEDDARRTVHNLLKLDPRASVDSYLRNSPSGAYPIGQRFAQLLRQAGLPQAHH